MLLSRKTLVVSLVAPLIPLLIFAQQTTEKVDLSVIHRIKAAELGGGGRGGGGRGGGEGRGAAPIMNTMYNLTDRFGPHGAVGVLLLEYHRAVWHLKLLATSCRVVSFGAGAVILNWLIDQAAQAGVHLVADFRPTDRNRMMDIAYRFAGFTTEACECLAGLGAMAGRDGVQCLHLTAEPRRAPATMRLIAPDLAIEHVLDQASLVP